MGNQLIALYELKRQNFLLGFIENPDRFSSALAYAYYHRVAPVFHEQIARETYDLDPFDELYAVDREFVLEVLRFIDEKDQSNELGDIEFYKLEEKFGGYRAKRIEIIKTLEYARIGARFNDAVYEAITSNAPAEANVIAREFTPNDVEFN